MEKKLITLVFIALLGLGGGYGIGYMVYQPQILDFQSDLEKIKTDLNDLKLLTEDTARNVNVTNFPTSWTANVTNFPTSWTQSPPTAYTPISLGQKFNWSTAEIVNVQQNYYVYSGHDVSCVGWDWSGRPSVGTIHLAKWLNGWVELSYRDGFPQKVSLSPYTLQIYYYSNNYLTCEFLEG